MDKKEIIVYAENEMISIKTYLESKNYLKQALGQFAIGELASGTITLFIAVCIDTGKIENAVLFGIASTITISLTAANYFKKTKALTEEEKSNIKTAREMYDCCEKELEALQSEESEYLDVKYVIQTYPVIYELYQSAKNKEVKDDMENPIKIYAKNNT